MKARRIPLSYTLSSFSKSDPRTLNQPQSCETMPA